MSFQLSPRSQKSMQYLVSYGWQKVFVQKIDKSINIDRSISIFKKKFGRASSPFHDLSYEPKIIKIHQVVNELWLAEKNVALRTCARADVLTTLILPPLMKTNSLRWSSAFGGARSRASRVSQLRE